MPPSDMPPPDLSAYDPPADERPIVRSRPPVSVGAFVATYQRDPDLSEPGLLLSLSVPLNPMLAVDVRAGRSWSFTELSADVGIVNTSEELLPYNPVEPDWSALLGTGDVSLRFTPFRGDAVLRGRAAPVAAYAWTGFGAVWTEDHAGFPDYVSERALAPSTTFGLGLSIGLAPRVVLSAESQRISYIERRDTSVLELHNDWRHGVGLTLSLGPAMSDAAPSDPA